MGKRKGQRMKELSGDRLAQRVALLRQVPIFAGLQEEALNAVAEHFRLRKYRRREMIFHQEDESTVVYLVAEGKVRVFMTSANGEETTIRIFSRGELIGEFAAIDAEPRSTSAQAVQESTLWELSQGVFVGLLSEIPELAMGVIRTLVAKLRWTTDYAELFARRDTAARLLHLLIHYAVIHGKEIQPGRRYELHMSLNQSDLASIAGARREWVNRIMKQWKHQGLIDYAQGRITILDLPAARAERDSRM
jgi:CRP-like cAMP-binding protein